MIRHNNIHRIKPIHLMRQQVRTLMVGVVRQNEAGGHARVALSIRSDVTIHYQLKRL